MKYSSLVFLCLEFCGGILCSTHGDIRMWTFDLVSGC